jgi:hypothetical protein
MENQASSKNIIINYGIYYGVISILISLVAYATGTHLPPHWSIQVLNIATMIALIVMGIKKFKTDNGGFMSWGQAVKIGVGLSMISALITIAYNQLFINFIEPDFMQQLMTFQEQTWIDQGLTSDQIEGAKAITEKFSGPVISSAIGLVVAAFFSFIVSAIAGAVMKESAEEQY